MIQSHTVSISRLVNTHNHVDSRAVPTTQVPRRSLSLLLPRVPLSSHAAHFFLTFVFEALLLDSSFMDPPELVRSCTVWQTELRQSTMVLTGHLSQAKTPKHLQMPRINTLLLLPYLRTTGRKRDKTKWMMHFRSFPNASTEKTLVLTTPTGKDNCIVCHLL